eukprot:CAMPEP_0113605616 /NCGR_PEP_ID=MMETSP0017_2-20120614/2422_1 /TAXON_ID=2856 /ORGANISM="Cylindrotheca closterium" /LENGTH=441 /DNA_ID=CAMNT_0000514117 /DNA_START=112 /DNA_END=1437 /DNA_ORIENTATION=- /assembly_acc=CAM_ASM_000147
MKTKAPSQLLLSVALLSPLIHEAAAFVAPSKILPTFSLTSTETNDSEISLNPVVASVKVSKTVEIFSLVKQMEADGEKVTSLCVGEPDFLPPKAVLDAATAAIRRGDTKYTAVTGTADLRNAIADDLKRRKGLEYDPQTEIIVGNGAKQSVYQGVLATCGPGDAAIIPAPYWPSYPEMVALAGAEPIIVETTKESGYLITPEALRTVLEANPHAKLFFLCSPGNPTGGVYREADLSALAKVLKDYPNVAVLADEIYERLVYEGNCPSFASIDRMFSRTMTVNGFSKAYAMTGLRLGYVAAPQPLAKAITTIQSQLTSCAGSISQAAGVAALTQVSDDELLENVKIMKEKRDFVLSELEKIPGVSVSVPPNGAFYILPDVSGYFDGDDTELCLQLLKSKKLALVPGSSFGAPGTIRLSYATSMEELKIAIEKLADFLGEQST